MLFFCNASFVISSYLFWIFIHITCTSAWKYRYTFWSDLSYFLPPFPFLLLLETFGIIPVLRYSPRNFFSRKAPHKSDLWLMLLQPLLCSVVYIFAGIWFYHLLPAFITYIPLLRALFHLLHTFILIIHLSNNYIINLYLPVKITVILYLLLMNIYNIDPC